MDVTTAHPSAGHSTGASCSSACSSGSAGRLVPGSEGLHGLVEFDLSALHGDDGTGGASEDRPPDGLSVAYVISPPGRIRLWPDLCEVAGRSSWPGVRPGLGGPSSSGTCWSRGQDREPTRPEPVTEQQLLSEFVVWGSRSSWHLACASALRRAVSGHLLVRVQLVCTRRRPYRHLDGCWPGRLLHLARWRSVAGGSRDGRSRGHAAASYQRGLARQQRQAEQAQAGRGREGTDRDLSAHPVAPPRGIPSGDPSDRATASTAQSI